MAVLIRPLFLLFLFLSLTACGGGGGGDDDVARPTASASADKTEVNSAEGTVSLDGSASSSPNGSITTWQWRVLSRPDGSEAVIENADTDQASFMPDLPGTYVVRLVVNDGTASSQDTRSSRVTITALNPNPVAVVEDEINWILGTVQLDGSRSLPPDGGSQNSLVYHWELTQKPKDSTAELDQGNLIYPRFTADREGQYQAELVVEYNGKVSEPATVDINIVDANAIPMAKVAEQAEEVMLGDTVSLDGSVSEDANGDPLQYRWRLLNRPEGSSAQLSSTTTAQTSFVADSRDGQHKFVIELCVFDGTARDCTEEDVVVGLPDDAADTAPVAVITPGSNFTHEIERGADITIRGADSYDIDGDELSYEWSLTAYPDGYDPDADDTLQGILFYCSLGIGPCTSMEFAPSVDGDYTWRLTVSDGITASTTSETFTAMLGANRPPEAVANTTTGNPTTMMGQQVTLDGAESSDPDDNRLTYRWALIQRPDNSTAVLQGANTPQLTLATDAPGPYLAELVVTDEHGAVSNTDEVVILAKESNNAPITRITRSGYGSAPNADPTFGVQQPFLIKRLWREVESPVGGLPTERRVDTFRLFADSYDPDGDELTHLWIATQTPPGNEFEYVAGGDTCDFWEGGNEEPCQWITVAPTAGGTYVFNYQVYDGSDFAGPFTATVHTVASREEYPSLLLEKHGDDGYSYATPFSGNPPLETVQPTSRFVFEQRFFPEERSVRGSLPDFSEGDSARAQPNPMSMTDVSVLTASGGAYTFNIDNSSTDSRFMPLLWDLTNGREITDGYVLAQGEQILVVPKIRLPESLVPTTAEESEQLEEILDSIDFSWSLTVEGKPDWTLKFNAPKRVEGDDDTVGNSGAFSRQVPFIPQEIDFSQYLQ